LAGGRLDGGDDLAGDSQLRERPERRLTLDLVVADRLVQADQRLLLDVVAVAAHQEVPAALGPGEAAIALDQDLLGLAIAALSKDGEVVVLTIDERSSEAKGHDGAPECDEE